MRPRDDGGVNVTGLLTLLYVVSIHPGVRTTFEMRSSSRNPSRYSPLLSVAARVYCGMSSE
jgi:hypothetical protein